MLIEAPIKNTMNDTKQKLLEGRATIAVIGLGYVGLPLAVEKAKAGFTVLGIDRKRERVDMVNRGENYIADVLVDDLAEVVKAGKLRATQEYSEIATADVVTICVPTPLDKNKQPDTSYIESVMEKSLPYVHKGQLIVLESTTYPGTTEEVIKPQLEACGFTVGEDIYLAFSPERVDPGNRHYKIQNTPKVVGGVTAACTEVAKAMYNQIIDGDVYTVSSPRAAEMTKLFENIFRIVNISLVDELALLCERMGIDIWEVIEAAKTKPFGFMPFYPGPGLGGHCIPLDPFYLLWKAREYDFTTRFIELAGEINDAMPYHVVERATELLNQRRKALNGAKILLLGVAYKKNIDDIRESPALKIAKLLANRGAILSFHDPFVPKCTVGGQELVSTELSSALLKESDLVILTTAHTNVDYKFVVDHAPLVFDTRNATRGINAPNIIRLGVGTP
jgi:UDP-N-acetyl-D-glucosamine dehydrogenase